MKKLLALLLALVMTVSFYGCDKTPADPDQTKDDSQIQQVENQEQDSQTDPGTSNTINEYGWYYSAEDVMEYINTYGELPDNYITKEEAQTMGWEGGSIEEYLPGFAIGGDCFANREGYLPDETGRIWYECDIDTLDADSRGAKRLVYSNDGLIYYTEDHYETFILLSGEE